MGFGPLQVAGRPGGFPNSNVNSEFEVASIANSNDSPTNFAIAQLQRSRPQQTSATYLVAAAGDRTVTLTRTVAEGDGEGPLLLTVLVTTPVMLQTLPLMTVNGLLATVVVSWRFVVPMGKPDDAAAFTFARMASVTARAASKQYK